MRNTLKDFHLQGKRFLLRCELNVPMKGGVIKDDFRIAKSIPTITYIAEQGGRCVILAHLGRPSSENQEEFSLEPIAQRLEELLGKKVLFIKERIGEGAEKKLEQLTNGQVALLENIRFYEGEEKNEEKFAKQLASLGDIYGNDAFGVSHRAHASITGIPKYLPSVAGLLLEKEIQALEKVSKNPERPLVIVVGGTKVKSKAGFLKTISEHANAILLGDLITAEVKEKDIQVAQTAELVYAIEESNGNLDLGPKTIEMFQEKIKGANTIFWAGPLGMIEEEKYEKGSIAIAQAILESNAFAVAGGGELAAFLGKHNFREKFSHVSTGGGAMLAFLSGEELPGLEALETSSS